MEKKTKEKKEHVCPERERCKHCGIFLPIKGNSEHKHKK